MNPFSFWKTIYLNPASHTPLELEAVLKHEQVHVAEYHTLDVLLAETALLFCWMNPAAWLTKKAICENLEFITDGLLLAEGIDSRQYQYQLLKISQLAQTSSIVNNFNFITLKTRISMMNKKRSSNMQAFTYLLLLPITIGLVTACNLPDEHAEPLVLEKSTDVAGIDENSATYYLDGVEVSKAEIDKLDPSEIAQVDVVKNDAAGSLSGETKGEVSVTTRQALGTDADNPNIVRVRTTKDAAAHEKAPELSDMLIMVDGEEVSQEYMEALAPEKIERMDVLKGDNSVKRFGAKGKKGVILITTKQ